MPCGWGGNHRSGVALAMRHMRSADVSTCVVPRTLSSYKDRIFCSRGASPVELS